MIKQYKPKKFIFASSSSVYGDIKPFPKSETSDLNPINLYSLSKLSNEHFAKSMSKSMKNKKNYRLKIFYNLWTMGKARHVNYEIFDSLKKNKTFLLYNKGDHYRDFTYIDDAVSICEKLISKKLKKF